MILVVDDDISVTTSLSLLLKQTGERSRLRPRPFTTNEEGINHALSHVSSFSVYVVGVCRSPP